MSAKSGVTTRSRAAEKAVVSGESTETGQTTDGSTVPSTATTSGTQTNTWSKGSSTQFATETETSRETGSKTEERGFVNASVEVRVQDQASVKSSSKRRLAAKRRLLELQLALLDAQEEAEGDSDEEEVTIVVPREPKPKKIEGRPANQESYSRKAEPQAAKPTEEDEPVTKLAIALSEAMKMASQGQRDAPPKYLHDLPTFDGTLNEWIPFKTVYQDTSKYFSEAQNVARLRKTLKGEARDTVKGLLYSSAGAEDVMEALERSFGRPEVLILHELESVKKMPRLQEDGRNISAFASKVANCVASVQALNRPQYLYSPELTSKIVEKLNTYTRYEWFKYSSQYPGEPELQRMARFLKEMSDQCGAMSALQTRREDKRDSRRKHINVARERDSSSESSRESDRDSDSEGEHAPIAVAVEVDKKPSTKRSVDKIECSLCRKTHYLRDCEEFKALSVEDRWSKAKEAHICFRCLIYKHRRFQCRAKPCGLNGCKRGHHRLLHQEEGSPTESEPAQVTSVNTVSSECKTYLKVVPIELHGSRGKTETYALLDEGSTMTLIEEDTALTVAPPGKCETLKIEGVGGKRINYTGSFKLSLRIKGKWERNFENVKAQTINSLNLITQEVSRQTVRKYSHLRDLEDVLCYERVRPTVLIGQDNWHLIVSREIRQGRQNEPAASFTSLGWVLHGQIDSTMKSSSAIINHIREPEKEEIENLLKEHFSIESLGIEPKRSSSDPEEKALRILQETCERLPDGRMQVGLLWKNEKEKMPQSRIQAEKRLKNLEKRMNADAGLRREYTEQVEGLLRKNYAEKALNESTSLRTWYLPHFAVRHPQKKKIRMVFDAAARSEGRSLNDALLSGPDLLQSLFGVLLRFREGPVAVMADIKEMFLQIKIKQEDRDSQRFLWREPNGELVEYRMSSLIFGATSSPCSAIFAKNRNAQDFKEKYPDTVRAVEKHFYMDDYLQAFNSQQEAQKTVNEMIEIHNAAHFELRGWCSNESKLQLSQEGEVKTTTTLGDHQERTLGIIWDIKKDAFKFALNLRNTPEEVVTCQQPPTKRQITSAVMSVYDPLGFASPVIVQGKKIIQHLWKSGTGWDEEIPAHYLPAWRTWLQDVKQLRDLNIPRNIITSINSSCEIHCFTDASEHAYAAAVYIKVGTEVKLLAAKSRVAPLKPISIPRLELQAAVLGSRLTKNLKKELTINIENITFWTDSRTVLCWLRAEAKSFKPFVAHRVAEIQENTKINSWRWVPTKENVADDATRDTPKNFCDSHRWFTGPAFLKKERENWPSEEKFGAKESDDIELRKVYVTNSVVKFDPLPDASRFSKFQRLCRATAMLLLSIERFKRQSKDVNPQARHLHSAEILLLQKAQREDFGEEIKCLKNKSSLKRESKLKRICIELDPHDLIRATGRIDRFQNENSDQDKKPIILHAKNHITKLLIHHYHEKFMHANHETVINEIRQKYFILGLRNEVRNITYKCQWCKLRRAKPTRPDEGELPRERLSSHTPPFNCSAIDYFGPMHVTVGRRTEKRWGVIITCLTTRAIHLELAASLTPSSAILALRRFFARRGTPTVLFSDNGTNFVKANKELQDALKNYATSKKIVWKFIPPGAPHMGGAWERLIRTIKHSLSAVLNEKAPKEETLHTLLLEVEHVVNSRPLTPVSPDLSQEALSPNHFLLGRSCGATPIGDFNTAYADSKSWKLSQQWANLFWTRWTKEYLPLLIPKKPSGSPHHTEPKVGDIVLIVDGLLPRGCWPRGEVTKTFNGKDHRVRVVEVRTKLGYLKRPTSRLIVLA